MKLREEKEADQVSTIGLQTRSFKVLICVGGRKRMFQTTKQLHQLSNNRQTITNLTYNRGPNT